MCVYTLKMILNKSKMIIIIVFLCRKSGTNDLFNTTIPLLKKKETPKSFIKYKRKVPADNMSTNKRRGAFTL